MNIRDFMKGVFTAAGAVATGAWGWFKGRQSEVFTPPHWEETATSWTTGSHAYQGYTGSYAGIEKADNVIWKQQYNGPYSKAELDASMVEFYKASRRVQRPVGGVGIPWRERG